MASLNFRNYEKAQLVFDEGITLITGNNGNGKTNLLEAIAWFSKGKSFRGAPNEALILQNKEKLMKNRRGRIVSKSLHNRAKREDRLGRAGWTAKKGKFGAVRISPKGTRKARGRGTKKRSRRRSGKRCRNSRGHFKKC